MYLNTKSKKGIVLCIFVMIHLLSANHVFAESIQLSDIDNSSAYAREAILSLAQKGIISGDERGYFNPLGKLTRSDMAKLLVEVMKIDTSEIPAEPDFKDVPRNHWAYAYIEAAYRAGIVKGIAPGVFGINETCSREQIAVMLVRSQGLTDDYMGADMEHKNLDLLKDEDSISSWAESSIEFVMANKLMYGTSDRVFSPKLTASREQMAVLLDRFMNNEAAVIQASDKIKSERKIKIKLNEDWLNINSFPANINYNMQGHSPIVRNGEVLVPTVLFSYLGTDAGNNTNPDRMLMIERVGHNGYVSITMKVGSVNAYKNIQDSDPYKDEGKFIQQRIELKTAPELVNGLIYIPIVPVMEAFGAEAAWDEKSFVLSIHDQDSPKYPGFHWLYANPANLKSRYSMTTHMDLNNITSKGTASVDYHLDGAINNEDSFNKVRFKVNCVWDAFNLDSSFEETKVQGNRYIRDLKSNEMIDAVSGKAEFDYASVTKIEDILRKSALMSANFSDSELVSKQENVDVNGQKVDKYTVELRDNALIRKYFEMQKYPAVKRLETFNDDLDMDPAKAYKFEYLKFEVYMNPQGQMVKDQLIYSGTKDKERCGSIDEWAAGNFIIKEQIKFRVSTEAEFYDIGKAVSIQTPEMK